MARAMLAFVFSAICLTFGARGLDLPVTLGFQLGFNIRVIPGPNDASRELGLGVAVDKIVSDKTRVLVVSGVIANFGDVPRDGVEMRFAVTSYVGTGVSAGKAVIEPTCIAPGGVASFSARIALDSEKPRFAMYAVSACAPPAAIAEEPHAPAIEPPAEPEPEDPGAANPSE